MNSNPSADWVKNEIETKVAIHVANGFTRAQAVSRVFKEFPGLRVKLLEASGNADQAARVRTGVHS